MIKKKQQKFKQKKDKKKEKPNKPNFFIRLFVVEGKFSFKALVKNIALPVIGGLLIGYLTMSGINTYNSLKKPMFTPPNITFPIVWTILYILMGLAAYRIYMKNSIGKKDDGAYFYYLIQLALNFFWSILFFNLKLYGLSFILIIVLLLLIIVSVIKFFKVDKIAGILMIPYIIWVSYATVLSFFIWMLNEM